MEKMFTSDWLWQESNTMTHCGSPLVGGAQESLNLFSLFFLSFQWTRSPEEDMK